MNRLLCAAAALACAVGLSVCAHAQMTTVTATNIKMKGTAVPAGTVTFVPTDALGNPVPITAGGSLYDAQGFTGTITNGAIAGGFQVPDECTAVPAKPNVALSYQIQVYNSSAKTSFTLTKVAGVCGTSWALDSYTPTQSAVIASTGLVSGSTVPAHCANTSIFYKTTNPSATYNCVAGVYVLQTSSGGATLPTTSSLLKGDNNGGAVAATAGTDYATPASVTAASSAAAAAQTTANAAIPATQKGAASGVATLDASGKIPQSQIASPLSTTGIVADYQFPDGSGTAVTDSSGNGNDGAFIAGHAPVWVKNGLQFTAATQGVNLPAALNSAQTFEILAYINPLPNTNGISTVDQYPLFVGNSLGLTGLTLLHSGSVAGTFSIGTNAGGGTQTVTNETTSGLHVYTYVLGTGGGNLDHFYIDGVECTYQNHGSSAGKQSSGNLTLGSPGVSPYATSGFIGTFYRVRALSGQLSSSDVASDASSLLAQEAASGVSVTPPQYAGTTPLIQLVGDSLTCAWNGTTCSTSYSWGSQLSLNNQPTYTVKNWGVYGSFSAAMASAEPWRAAQYCKSYGGPSLAIFAGGTNDLQYRTVTQAGQSAASAIQALKVAGCRVFITDVLSRSGNSNATGTPTNDAQKNGYNALVASQWKAWGADGFIDWGADPNLGADGAFANTTYFLGDGVHNATAGEARKAAIASNALNYYLSPYNDANPHYITASGTLTSSDAAVSVGTLSADIALVMPDCTGPSGGTFVISNPQAAHGVTIAGGASQPINGLATAITIPANSTVVLRDVANAKSSSGCHWVM